MFISDSSDLACVVIRHRNVIKSDNFGHTKNLRFYVSTTQILVMDYQPKPSFWNGYPAGGIPL